MGTPRRSCAEQRLEAYFATLRPSFLGDALKRSASNWQIYAAVTGSALAMATGASAALIGNGRDIAPEPSASVRPMLLVEAPEANAVQAPYISPAGVVPIFGKSPTIQPGEWVSIYGNHLAATTAVWNGDFPQSLGGTSVLINGKPAYLMFVSPGQINLQAPDDTTVGSVSVVVTTAGGSVLAGVTLGPIAPSFSLLEVSKSGSGYVAGIILRSDGSGAFGGGAYDILGPTGNHFGYETVAAQAGDTVELFGVGFGPTTPAVPSGQAFSGAAPINSALGLTINSTSITPTFAGLSSAGLYQINLVVPPGLGEGPVPLQAVVGGAQTQPDVVFPLRRSGGSGFGTAGPTVGVGPTFPFSTGSWSSPPGTGAPGTGAPGTGGPSGGTGSVRRHKIWTPQLRFGPSQGSANATSASPPGAPQ